MKIDLEESHVLALRLKMHLQPFGIELDADRFQRMIEEDNRIPSILKFCAEVLYPEIRIKEEERSMASSYVEDLSDDEDYDLGYTDTTIQSSASNSFDQFIKSLSTIPEQDPWEELPNARMSPEDKYNMFTVNSKYSRGSVEVARGSRMSFFPRKQHGILQHSRLGKIAREAHKRAARTNKAVIAIENRRACTINTEQKGPPRLVYDEEVGG